MSYLIKIITFTCIVSVASPILASFNWFSYDQSNNKSHGYEDYAMQTQEKTPFLLRFLYNNFFGSLLRKGLTQKWFSALVGCYCNTSMSKFHIPAFIEEHGIDMNQAEKNSSEFSSFNDFFTRRLKPDARPIDTEPNHIISPADGNILVFEHSNAAMRFPIKQSIFNLEQFLGDEKLAKNFEGGTIIIFRLAPHHYHRFHFPIDCIPSKAHIIHGRYESVNPVVYYTGIQPLTENERHLTLLETSSCGTIAMVSVGALCVGKIIETYKPDTLNAKGQEAGYFSFGGSTLVLIFKRNMISVNPEIIARSAQEKETPITMGAYIASIIE